MLVKMKKIANSAWKNFDSWVNKNLGWILCPPHKLGKEEQNKMYK
jgi:hypothetical protein